MLPYSAAKQLAYDGVKNRAEASRKLDEGKYLEGSVQGLVSGVQRVASYTNPLGSYHGHRDACKELDEDGVKFR